MSCRGLALLSSFRYRSTHLLFDLLAGFIFGLETPFFLSNRVGDLEEPEESVKTLSLLALS